MQKIIEWCTKLELVQRYFKIRIVYSLNKFIFQIKMFNLKIKLS